MLRLKLIVFFFISATTIVFGQDAFDQELQPEPLKKLLKFNIINPSIEWQIPNSDRNLVAINIGVGYQVSYPSLTESFQSGGVFLLTPFLDVQNRVYINREKLGIKRKVTSNNSGAFITSRFLIRGKEIESTVVRTSNIDMAFGLGYGFQKSKKRINFAFTICPYLYFDSKGNFGFFPFIPEFGIGYNLD